MRVAAPLSSPCLLRAMASSVLRGAAGDRRTRSGVCAKAVALRPDATPEPTPTSRVCARISCKHWATLAETSREVPFEALALLGYTLLASLQQCDHVLQAQLGPAGALCLHMIVPPIDALSAAAEMPLRPKPVLLCDEHEAHLLEEAHSVGVHLPDACRTSKAGIIDMPIRRSNVVVDLNDTLHATYQEVHHLLEVLQWHVPSCFSQGDPHLEDVRLVAWIVSLAARGPLVLLLPPGVAVRLRLAWARRALFLPSLHDLAGVE
mmetsp:Transcript_83785/g.233318  ORF Transcript_83785/g.233318 Transcript_83785/m.233318 type:complete len:263 (-) Transcript_83785:551-1339(-)